MDQLESYNLGKYEVHDFNWNADRKRGNVLMISAEDDFPEDATSLLDIEDSKGTKIFRLFL